MEDRRKSTQAKEAGHSALGVLEKEEDAGLPQSVFPCPLLRRSKHESEETQGHVRQERQSEKGVEDVNPSVKPKEGDKTRSPAQRSREDSPSSPYRRKKEYSSFLREGSSGVLSQDQHREEKDGNRRDDGETPKKPTAALSSPSSGRRDRIDVHKGVAEEGKKEDGGEDDKQEERLTFHEPNSAILSSAFRPCPPSSKKKLPYRDDPRRERGLKTSASSNTEEERKKQDESHGQPKTALSSSTSSSSVDVGSDPPSRSSTTIDSSNEAKSCSSFPSSTSASSLSLGDKEGERGREQRSKRNFVKENARTAGHYRRNPARRSMGGAHGSSLSQQNRHENFGKIPEYLTVSFLSYTVIDTDAIQTKDFEASRRKHFLFSSSARRRKSTRKDIL